MPDVTASAERWYHLAEARKELCSYRRAKLPRTTCRIANGRAKSEAFGDRARRSASRGAQSNRHLPAPNIRLIPAGLVEQETPPPHETSAQPRGREMESSKGRGRRTSRRVSGVQSSSFRIKGAPHPTGESHSNSEVTLRADIETVPKAKCLHVARGEHSSTAPRSFSPAGGIRLCGGRRQHERELL